MSRRRKKKTTRGPAGTGPLDQEGLDQHSELQYLRASAASAGRRRRRRRTKRSAKTPGELRAWVEERAGKIGREAREIVPAPPAAADLDARIDSLADHFDARAGR